MEDGMEILLIVMVIRRRGRVKKNLRDPQVALFFFTHANKAGCTETEIAYNS
jgi:hypothetical protein